jgi:hypothetical protein
MTQTTTSPDMFDVNKSNIFMNLENGNTIQIGSITTTSGDYIAENSTGKTYVNSHYKNCLDFLVNTYERYVKPTQVINTDQYSLF